MQLTPCALHTTARDDALVAAVRARAAPTPTARRRRSAAAEAEARAGRLRGAPCSKEAKTIGSGERRAALLIAVAAAAQAPRARRVRRALCGCSRRSTLAWRPSLPTCAPGCLRRRWRRSSTWARDRSSARRSTGGAALRVAAAARAGRLHGAANLKRQLASTPPSTPQAAKGAPPFRRLTLAPARSTLCSRCCASTRCRPCCRGAGAVAAHWRTHPRVQHAALVTAHPPPSGRRSAARKAGAGTPREGHGGGAQLGDAGLPRCSARPLAAAPGCAPPPPRRSSPRSRAPRSPDAPPTPPPRSPCSSPPTAADAGAPARDCQPRRRRRARR